MGGCNQAKNAADLYDELLILILLRYQDICDIQCKTAVSARVAADVDLMAQFRTHGYFSQVQGLVHCFAQSR